MPYLSSRCGELSPVVDGSGDTSGKTGRHERATDDSLV